MRESGETQRKSGYAELVEKSADAAKPDQAAVHEILRDIEVLAQFRPHAVMAEYQWWVDEVGRGGP